jgi:DNA-binding response OmpR family regulator
MWIFDFVKYPHCWAFSLQYTLPIDLTPKEFALLEYFMYHPKQIVTREMIEQHIWNYDFECNSNVIDVYVRRLRRKIDDPFEVKLLATIRGIGYRLTPPQ